MKTLIILPYCPQITQGDSDKGLCDTLHVEYVVILLGFMASTQQQDQHLLLYPHIPRQNPSCSLSIPPRRSADAAT